MATTSVDATTVTFWQVAATAVSHSSQAPLATNAAFRFKSNAQLGLAVCVLDAIEDVPMIILESREDLER